MKKILLTLIIFSIISCIISISIINAQENDQADDSTIQEQWTKLVNKYIKSADSLVTYGNKMITTIDKFTILSNEKKASLQNKIKEWQRDKIESFKQALQKEAAPQDSEALQKRKSELSESIRFYKDYFKKINTSISRIKAFEKLVIYCDNKIAKKVKTSSINAEIKNLIIQKYNASINEIKTHIETIPDTDINNDTTNQYKQYLKDTKTKIKNIDTKFKIELTILSAENFLNKIKDIFKELKDKCTNEALIGEIQENLNKRSEHLDRIKALSAEEGYDKVKIEIKELKKEFKSDIVLLLNLDENCSTENN